MNEQKPHHTLPVLIILLAAALVGLAFTYWNPSEVSAPQSAPTPKVTPLVLTPKPPIVELNIQKTAKPLDTKAAILARVATVNKQPLYPNEREAILTAYPTLMKLLTEAEKQQIIAALNTR